MKVKVIKTESEYESVCKRIYELMHASEKPIVPGTSEADEMELLSLLVEKYERDHYPIEAPDPIEAIKFRMEQMNLKQKDIAPLFGGKTRVSEVLGKKRPLSVRMIILLNRYLGIPLESLITGNKSIKLKPVERKAILEVPSIRDYVKIYPDKRALA
jgi:HTH-type transcriptional regulator/antitoxin HigA